MMAACRYSSSLCANQALRAREESRQPASFSFCSELPSVVIGWIAVHGVDMHCRITAQPLRRVLDDEIWSLNPVVGRDVATGSNTYRTAPGKPGVVQAGFDLGHSGRSRTLVNDARP